MEQLKRRKQKSYWWRHDKPSSVNCQGDSRPGQTCKHCHQGILAYDGLFILACPVCGHVAESGAFT